MIGLASLLHQSKKELDCDKTARVKHFETPGIDI
jgi:hypothetical protein